MADETLNAAPEAASAESAATEITEASDHTPEPENVEETVAEEAPESSDSLESDDTQTADAPETAALVEDPLSDPAPITPETVAKMRVSKAEREQLTQFVNEAQKHRELVDSGGGEFGLSAVAPLGVILGKAEASPEEVTSVFQSLFEANAPVTKQVTDSMVEGYLLNPPVVEPILQKLYGDNATLSNIKKLLAYDKAGYIDYNADTAILGQDPDVLDRHATELEAKDSEIRQLRERIDNPPVESRAVSEFENDFYSDTKAVIEPFFEQVNWPKDGAFAKAVISVIQSQLKASDQYANAEGFLRQTGVYRQGETLAPMPRSNLLALKNRAQALGKELIRNFQQDMRKVSENSRNRILAAKQEPAKETAPPKEMSTTGRPVEDRIKSVDERFKGRLIQQPT